MNIFYLHTNPKIAAEYHVDKHVVKMILESAQLLCTAHRVLDNNDNAVLYKATHKNHPCAVWVRQSKQNYMWLYSLFCELCDEYTYRYGKIHLTDTKLRTVLANSPINISSSGFTSPAQAMPEKYRNSNPIIAYRNYYIEEKKKFANWTNRNKPDWFYEEVR